MRLSAANLAFLPANFGVPQYDRGAHKAGIVHLGIGAFHRAHQAVYSDAAMNSGERDWCITGVSLRSASVHDQLAPQDGLYSVTTKGEGTPETCIVGAVAGVLVAGRDGPAIVSAIAAADARIVTFTVTEKGYHLSANGRLNFGDPAIAEELEAGRATTIYGFLAAGLARRREEGFSGLTLLSCDNLAANGRKLKAALMAYLDRVDPSLAQWTTANCTFPCSMVDRIVPATTATDLAQVEQALGMRDEGAVVTEPFCQWVIEDDFAAGRPRWEDYGAQMVDDVEAYETAKLRMLNGAHSALAYLGLGRGLELVSEAIGDPAIAALVDQLMRVEAASSFDSAPGQDIAAYADQLLKRFANPALPHRLAQIAMDGSQKIPQRWLDTLRIRQARGEDSPALTQALAAWIVFVRGTDHSVDDPRAEELGALWRSAGEHGIVGALFGEGGLFAQHYVAETAAQTALSQHISSLLAKRS